MTSRFRGAFAVDIAACVLLSVVAPVAVAQTSAETNPELGKKVYEKICADCHGPKGQGNGPKAKRLGFFPRDFSLGTFKCRCTPSGQPPTDEDLFRTVTRGLPGTPMIAHEKMLSEQERWAVVRFIKTLSPKFSAPNLPACAQIPQQPPPASQLAVEGQHLYRLMQCGKCHGVSGRGDGPAASTLKDDWGRPIKPYNFVVAGNFKCGNDDRDLYRTLRTGLAGSPMPSFAAALLFAGDEFSPAGLEALGDATEIKELTQYLRGQPDAAALKAMSDQARQEVSSTRTWALVQYLRTLLAR